MSYVFDPEVVLHWDLFQKESPGSSERSFERRVCTVLDCLKFYMTMIGYVHQILLG